MVVWGISLVEPREGVAAQGAQDYSQQKSTVSQEVCPRRSKRLPVVLLPRGAESFEPHGVPSLNAEIFSRSEDKINHS